MAVGQPENAGVGPYELQEPVWAKMSGLAPGGGNNKKRKKSETKPQAQINKCNNEKRRREQENNYIEELAELISANFADMSSLSVKPDKCAILQATVNRIREQRDGGDPVQQGEVSSSRPAILPNEIYGPLLLEALDGFVFVVSPDGNVEHVTDNVSLYIKFLREELMGKCIYDYVHRGDHTKFTALFPKAENNWAEVVRQRPFSARFLVKPNDGGTLEDKQQQVDYELMQVSSTPLKDHFFTPSEEDLRRGSTGPHGTPLPPAGTQCILCMASRISHREKVLGQTQTFTTKLDTSGRIIGVDTSSIVAKYSSYLNNKDLMNQLFKDLVAQQEVHKWNAHFRETLTAGQARSALYRFQLANDKFVDVQTKSKLFKTSPHSPIDSIDFVMSTHTIVTEDDLNPTDPGGGNPVNNNNSTITNNNNSSSSSSSSPGVGGPLMTSVVNGARSGTAVVSSASDATTSSSLLNTTTTSFTTSYNLDSDFNLDIFPSTTWDLENHGWEARSDSRQSLTPVSTPTPRPPSNPSYSPATTVSQSPLASQFFAQPSPNVPNNPATPVSYSSTFSFSPIAEPPPSYPPMEDQQKDTKANVMEEASTMMSDSIRLRHLLTKPPNQVDSSDGDNKNKILKGLLNQQDDDEGMSGDNRTSPRGLMGRGPVAGPSSMELPNKSGNGAASAGNNNMLRKLLNDTSDEDDSETRGMKKKSNELLQQLLKGEPKEQADGDDAKKGQVQSNADLLRSLGFSSSPAPSEPNNHVSSVEGERVRKRPEEDTSGRRTSDGAQVSSSAPSGQSKLWEKNRMLVSLLNKEPGNVNQPIPYIPEDELHAIPQERLPKVNTNRAQLMNAMSQGLSQVTSMAAGRMSTVNMGRPMQTTNYLSSILTSPNNAIQRSESSHQTNHVDNFYNSIATTSNATAVSMESMEKDETLSNLLEEVISTYPDFYSSFPQNERVSKSTAISMIQNSLMQCESGMKSPPSPGSVLSATPPTYISAITTQNNQFPPPPNYNQAAYSINSVNNINNNNINTIKQHRLQVRTGAAPYNTTAGGINAQQQIIQQRKQQEQQKRRLLLQQQQQLVIPSNAATSADMNSGLQNFDILLKNTVAPNVSLQRSASVPESQLSPGYNAQPVSGQSPYSPHSQLTSPISQQANYPQTTVNNYQQVAARLSPLGNYNQQLSPRQVFNQPNSSQGSANWQQQPQPRLSLQNPMLNAQLTRAPPGSQQQQQQQQPTLNSPGNVPSRHSPYASTPESFPTSTSPNSAYNQSSYLRIQRANSAPTATTQLAGGLGSPRPYGGREHHPPHPYSPAHPHPASHHPMMYPQQQQQDSSQYHCSYSDQAQGLQLPYNGQAVDRGRHLQPQGVSGNGPSPTSEYVRQELRAVVGARTGQQPAQQPQPNRTTGQLLNQQQVADLESLGIHFEMPASGASESPKLWATMGSDMSSMSPQPATSRSTMEESRPGDHKASLLQKLLSE